MGPKIIISQWFHSGLLLRRTIRIEREIVMPKQVRDKTKATRMILVLEAIKRHGKCSPKDIAYFVSQKIDIDPQKESFKKAIHNDLKSLLGDNIVGIEYRTRDGELIPLGDEDKFKNKRNVFYFLLGEESETKGAGLFKKIGIHFQPQKSSFPEWKVSDVKNKFLPNKNSVCVLFRINSKYLSLETELDDLPFTLVIAGESKDLPSHDKLKSEFDSDKVSFLSIPDEYLEGFSAYNRLGHFYLKIYKDSKDKIKCDIDYLIDKNHKKELNTVIEDNRVKWEKALEKRETAKEKLFRTIEVLNNFQEEYEVQDCDPLEQSQIEQLNHYLSTKVNGNIPMFENINQLKNTIKDAYQNASKEFDSIDTLSCTGYDDVEFSKITYSRVNDFIDDANTNGRLKLPPKDKVGELKNLGDKNKFHARKPPKIKQTKKTTAKFSYSKMESTEKFFIWTKLHDIKEALPVNIKVGPNLQIIVSDFYPNSSYSQKELDILYKSKKKAA